ncbi:MAG: alkaline phosphatase family protein [Candidatus Dormibacteraceae bacterium]
MGRGLVVLHVDGLGADSLEQALRDGDMPFTQHLIGAEGYAVHRYRCGVPSTTPFAQAGILYGDNSEIPSFRWWDRERRVLVQFGAGSTFKKVADKYFHGCRPLTQDGACIAACYPAGAKDDFGIAYQDRSYSRDEKSRSAWSVVLPYLANPIHLGDWVWQTAATLGRTVSEYTSARAKGKHPARPYVISDALEEIFVHHLTRYAVVKAMRKRYSPIYAGFYAFDEAGHAFGPDDRSSLQILKHVDHTIRKVAQARGDRYELVVLSDHGQIETVPFNANQGPDFGQVIANLLPGYQVRQMKGKAYGPAEDEARGHVNVTCSGGLAHIYFADEAGRLDYRDLVGRHPDLARSLSGMDKVALVMARDGTRDVFLNGGSELDGDAIRALLAQYDDAEILLEQLSRLNSFRNSGDLVLFGSFIQGKQVNFENQAGGHGSIGGEQLHPFVLAKGEWGIDTTEVRGAHQLHPILSSLRDRLA